MSGFVKIAIDDYYSDNNWTTIINKYWMLAERVSDPRVQGWLLFDTPIGTFAMVVAYLIAVLVVVPMWMENRKPFSIKNLLVCYNAGQVLLSLYMFYEHLMSGWWADYSLTCQPVDYSDSEKARRMLHLCWVYYFSKLSEFADTIFFVLRKKKSQITWLHLYHHSLTPFEAWLLVKFIAGGHGTFSNIVNNLVHVIMYAYYMMAAMGPQYQKYLWWKKHLTTLQLIQFFMVLFHSISALVYDCGYPKIIASGLILHSSIFILLFTNFYMKAYNKEKPRRAKVDHCNNNNGYISNGHATNGHIAEEYISNGHLTNGHTTDDYISDGHVTNRHLTEEYVSNGHLPNRHLTEEYISNGHLTNGHTTDDYISDGHLTNRHLTEEYVSNGHLTNGHTTDDYISDGHLTNRHLTEEYVSNGHVTNGHIPEEYNNHIVFKQKVQ